MYTTVVIKKTSETMSFQPYHTTQSEHILQRLIMCLCQCYGIAGDAQGVMYVCKARCKDLM